MRISTLGIGELARLTKVSVRTIRFYCDTGILATARSVGGHRRFTPDTVEQVNLVRRLRGLGLGLSAITDVLAGTRSVSEAVSAARADLDVALAALAWRRASLVAVEEAGPAERAARLDLLAAVEDGRAAYGALVAFWRQTVGAPWPDSVFGAFVAMSVPEPPVDPTPAQVVAYAEMVALTGDRSLAWAMRQGTHTVSDQDALLAGVDEALFMAEPLVAAGEQPGPGPALNQFVAGHAAGRGRRDSPSFRRELLRTVAVGGDQRLRRYWGLFTEVTGETSFGTTHTWLLDSLAESCR